MISKLIIAGTEETIQQKGMDPYLNELRNALRYIVKKTDRTKLIEALPSFFKQNTMFQSARREQLFAYIKFDNKMPLAEDIIIHSGCNNAPSQEANELQSAINYFIHLINEEEVVDVLIYMEKTSPCFKKYLDDLMHYCNLVKLEKKYA